MRKIIRLLVLTALALCGLSCSDSAAPVQPAKPPQPNPPIELTAADQGLAESTNRFGFNLFREISANEPAANNIFISPLSVSYALGMTRNGSAGTTREAMNKTLELAGLTDREINEAYRNLTRILIRLDPTVAFKIANSIWSRIGKTIQPEFVTLSRDYFDATVKEVDFLAPGTVDSINNWVNINTNGKIREIFKGGLPADVAMLLMNAIYFKGTWTHLFDSAESYDGTFYLSDSTEISSRMMSREDTLLYFANDLFEAVDLPYGDENFSMAILLPLPSVTPEQVAAQLNDANWAIWRKSFYKAVMPIAMPRFRFEYEVKLNDALQALGMTIAFGGGADFSKMFVDGVGWIDQVKHKTFVQVDENGTEAAAVTAVVMIDSFNPGMLINRPFIFLIHERQSGAILFIGKIARPVWNE